MIDKRTVELAKVLFSQGKNKSQIARELSTSARTIGRYLQYDDDPEFAEELAEIRKANQTKYITDAWRITHKALAIAEERLSDPKTSAKDAAVIQSILVGNVHMMETSGGRQVEEDVSVTFLLRVPGVIDGDTSRPLAESGDLPRLTSEVSGDDRGEGLGEDLLALSGGDQNLP